MIFELVFPDGDRKCNYYLALQCPSMSKKKERIDPVRKLKMVRKKG